MTPRQIILAFAALFAASGAGAQTPAPRAVSLDYCADQFLLAIADKDQIIAVSPGADEDYSYLKAAAVGVRALRPSLEEIAPQRPDVVLRFWGGSPRLGALLEQDGATVLTLDYASDFETVRANIRAAAAALHREVRGEAMIADLDARLAALARRPVHNEAALYVTPGGVTAGSSTMIDAIFSAARVRNATAEAGLSYWPPLPAEALILNPPGLIVAGFFKDSGEAANHWSAARHPAFRRVFDRTLTIHLPTDIISCPAWFSVDAAEIIAAGIDKIEAGHETH
ncbi:MAG: ABC transporter substrate-binding protein [Amphiplicatus sp.]